MTEEELNPKGDKINFFYYQVTDIWKRFCEEHATLFNLTCDEYTHLLKTDMDKLEETINTKSKTIDRINILDNLRSEIIDEINTFLQTNENVKKKYKFGKIKNVNELLSLMENVEQSLEEKYLSNFNNLLINIIEKIQAQNKKNHIFINKAIHSLNEMKGNVEGKKSYETYTKRGVTTNKVNNVVKKNSDELGGNFVKPS
ncbi:MAG: hypothetical protein CME68_02350 [Halobacteriovoraceae bacterium]|nr:hypothetical protein [Halobacteriovoraceae bacterium]